MVTHLADVLGHRFDMNSVSCLRQGGVRPTRKLLLAVFFVFVLKAQTGKNQQREPQPLRVRGMRLNCKADSPGLYLRYQRADILSQEDLRRIWNNEVRSSSFVVLLLVFYLAGRKEIVLSNVSLVLWQTKMKLL